MNRLRSILSVPIVAGLLGGLLGGLVASCDGDKDPVSVDDFQAEFMKATCDYFVRCKVAPDLDPLLVDDRAAVFGPIIAEVASGARTLGMFNQVRARMSAAHLLADPPDLWGRVAEARFQLARQGIQAHLVDLAIAVTASVRGHLLLTRDKDFVAIARAFPVDLELY